MKGESTEGRKEVRKHGRKQGRNAEKRRHDEPESPNEGACLRYMMD